MSTAGRVSKSGVLRAVLTDPQVKHKINIMVRKILEE